MRSICLRMETQKIGGRTQCEMASAVKTARRPVTARKARKTRPTAAKMFMARHPGRNGARPLHHLPQHGEVEMLQRRKPPSISDGGLLDERFPPPEIARVARTFDLPPFGDRKRQRLKS